VKPGIVLLTADVLGYPPGHQEVREYPLPELEAIVKDVESLNDELFRKFRSVFV
jgi:hypothetical protein